MTKNKPFEYFDIDLHPKSVKMSQAVSSVRTIYCGGERVKQIQVRCDDNGTAHTVRIIYK